jgi:hypothetical protein
MGEVTDQKLRKEIYAWCDELRRSATGPEIIQAIQSRLEIETNETKLRTLKFSLADEFQAQGNEAASDAINRELVPEVDYWYMKLRRTHRRAHDIIIKAIEDRIRDRPDAAEVDDLYRMLAGEYSFNDDHAAAAAIKRQQADKHPDDPLPLISLANDKLYCEDQPENAMELINRALEVAYRTGVNRRYALGSKARIALTLRRYDIVEAVLRDIMQLKIDPELPDIGRERDFFDRLPPFSIDTEVARQYHAYCLAVGLQKRRTGKLHPDEPDEFYVSE